MSERKCKFEPDEVDSLIYLKKLFQRFQLCLEDDETCMLLQTCMFLSSGNTGEQFKSVISAYNQKLWRGTIGIWGRRDSHTNMKLNIASILTFKHEVGIFEKENIKMVPPKKKTSNFDRVDIFEAAIIQHELLQHSSST